MKTTLASLALVLACSAPAMARTYKSMNVDTKNFKSVSLVKPACCDRFSFNALVSSKGNTRTLLIERTGGFAGLTGFSKVNLNRAYKPMTINFKDYKQTPIASGLMNPDLPRLTLLTAKDGSGKAFIERSGGFIRNPQAMFTQLKY